MIFDILAKKSAYDFLANFFDKKILNFIGVILMSFGIKIVRQ